MIHHRFATTRYTRTARLIALALSGICSINASAEIISVPDDHATIQSAIDAARGGDEIVIALGEYRETIDLLGKAVTLRSTDPGTPDVVARTIINGAGAPHVIRCVSGEDAATIISGLTITGGNADGPGEQGFGGGMYIASSRPTVRNCTFVENRAVRGGAMMIVSARPAIINCTFSANRASSGRGGGVFNHRSSPTIEDCVFWGNLGGGMANSDRSNPDVAGTVFASNSADNGGGMHNAGRSEPTVTNCTFTYNTGGDGGGMHNDGSSPRVFHATFTFNRAAAGAGIYNAAGSPTVTNCTFTDNAACIGGGMHSDGGAPVVTNCIFWRNAGGEIVGASSPVQVTYSNVQGGFAGRGNIDADPLFADPSCGQCHLSARSPCIDAGDSTAAGGPTAGARRRIVDDPFTRDTGIGIPCIDMGAREYQGAVCPARSDRRGV